MPTGPGWVRLGRYVTSRRVELGMKTLGAFAGETRRVAPPRGLNEKSLGKLERGQSVCKSSLAVVEMALRWTPGSAQAVIDGGEPAEVEPQTDDGSAALAAAIGRIERDPDLPATAKEAAIRAIREDRIRERLHRQSVLQAFPEAIAKAAERNGNEKPA